MLADRGSNNQSWHANAGIPAFATASAEDHDSGASPRQKSRQTTGRPLSLVIAGGGTGGHLFPGIAVADQVLGLHTGNRVHFIGTGNPFETRVLNQLGFAHDRIDVQPIKGKTRFHQVLALAAIPAGVAASIRILRRLRPDAVLGVGGYSAGPVVVAAWLLGIPRALHEQNRVPGMTNRFLAPFANRIYVSFEDTQLRTRSRKIRLTGNPVRKELLHGTPSVGQRPPGRNRYTVLVVGGSQGAHRLNRVVTAALERLKSRRNLRFIHQTGLADENDVKQAYGSHRVAATVQAFFDDMQTCYRQADLVICRAGASTVAELALAGKTVIFIPYPFAADDHQAANARELVSAGAAEMILEKDLTATVLARAIAAHMDAPQKGRAMGARLKKHARPFAARDIVADIDELISHKQPAFRF